MSLIRLIAVLLLALTATPAHAACTLATAVTAPLGTRTSYDMRTTLGTAQAAPAQLACSGSMLSLLSSDYVRATTTSTNAFRLRSAAGQSIGYRLSVDAAGNMAFAQGKTIDYLDPAVLTLLAIATSTAFQPAMFVAPTELADLPAGTYTDTVRVNWAWSICRLLGVAGICAALDRDTGQTTLTVTLTITRDCRITAPAIAFGSAPLVSGFRPVTQGVTIECTRGASYAVAFTSGGGGSARPWRRMSDGAGHALRYNLYLPDGVTIWDEANPQPVASPDTGTTTAQTQAYVAKIDTGQATPPPGSYSDTLSVLVSF
jgi:spore coat protein U-like protein